MLVVGVTSPNGIMNSIAETKKTSTASRVLITLASLFIIIAGLKRAESLLIPILMAFFIATVSFPITRWLRDHGLPRFFAVLITVLFDFVLIGGVVVFLVATVSQLRSRWESDYMRMLETKLATLREFIIDRMVQMGNDEAASRERVEQWLSNESLQQLVQGIETEVWWDASRVLLASVFGFLGSTFIVIVLTIFMLNEARMFGRRMSSVFASKGPNFHRVITACRDIQKYLGIKTVVSAVTGLLAYALCYFLGVELPELWGLLAFALNFIPAVGSVLAGIPPVLMALLMRDIQIALFVAGGYVGINAILGNFLEPMLLGRRFGISTLVVIFSVLFWGWLWGPVGMLLGVPLTMLLKVGLDNSNDFRWLAVAISKDEKKNAADETIIQQAAEPKTSV